MSEIFKRINDLAPFLTEKDLDEWIVPQLLDHYSSKIKYLAFKAYGSDGQCPEVAKKAFVERSRAEIDSAMKTFLFKSEHWKRNRSINSYLLKTLNRLSERAKWEGSSTKKVNVPVCPACKSMHRREFCVLDGKMWRCENCTSEVNRLEDIIEKCKESNNMESVVKNESRIRLHNTFSLHSRKGYRCPDCKRFIPESINGVHGISCPFSDCMFFGKVSDLEVMPHPVGLTNRIDLSLQTPLDEDGNGGEIQDTFAADNVDPDARIEMRQVFSKELEMLRSVMEEQLAFVKRTNSAGTLLQKTLMYEAYLNMLDKNPEDMVSYLVHRKQVSDIAIQSKIFQEYVRLMQDALPYTIEYSNKNHEVMSLLDPKISLFEGKTTFNAVIKNDGTIPNNTTEVYVGGRKFKYYGPCYLGLVLDVKNRDTGESIKSSIDEYTFVSIKMKNNIEPGTPVEVTHYFINSHYEIGTMVYLQRVRKKVVDKIYYKTHGTKREAGK